MWKIVKTTDNQHVGEKVDTIEKGNVITFPDGDVVQITQTFFNEDGNEVIIASPNYQMTLTKE